MKNRTKYILLTIYLIISILLNTVSSNYIYKNCSNVCDAQDLVLNKITNNYSSTMKLAEIIIVICLISFIYIFIKEKEKKMEWLFIFATFELFRGLLMPLTVMGSLNYGGFLTKFTTFDYGTFPSGHTAIPFLFFLFTYKKSKISYFYLASTIIVMFILLIGKQHYTIDVISTIFIAYSIKSFTEKNLKIR